MHVCCQSWLTLQPHGRSPPGSSVLGISQARILEWVAISSSRDLPNPRIKLTSSAPTGRFFTTEPPGEPKPSNVNGQNALTSSAG